LVVKIDVCHKPLLKTREFLLLLWQDDEAIRGLPRSVWRWSGWTGRSTRWDGWLFRTPLRFGKPRVWAPCSSHATEEESVVPPRFCRILFHAPRRLGNRVTPRRWLGWRWPSLLGEETCGILLYDCSILFSNIIPGCYQ
jgi:hypothetical protein